MRAAQYMINRIKTTEELETLKSLLKECQLPHEDITLDNNTFLGYYDSTGQLIASGGLEFHGASALLRSVAVKELFRNQALGKKILDDLFKKAADKKVTSIYLLTETAHEYFLKKGFKDTSRDEVPEELKKSSEFSSVCPASAKCMIYNF
jgi:amino-acid N-acetyltransferase